MNMNQNKKKLGQFYTTNADYILQNLSIPSNVELIEPFAGNGDLIKWANLDNIEMYDIDPKINNCLKRDTLLNPPIYKNKFIITNPPYLNKNKSKDKTIFDKYNTDDLYKASILSFINGNCVGGILIVPVNFICQNSSKLRNLFFKKYHITKLNIFEETVFDDTSYPICSFEFHIGSYADNVIDTTFYPSNKKINLTLSNELSYSLTTKLFPKIKSKYNIRRLVKNDDTPNNNLYLYAIDGGSKNNRIRLEINKNHLYGSDTDRSFCSIWSDCLIENEEYVVNEFNNRIEKLRNEYDNLFLTNFRNSTKHYSRKRIAFNQAYSLIEQILTKTKINNYDKL